MARPLTSIDPLQPVIRQRPLGLLADVDGTLAPIVARPEDARVPNATRALLEELTTGGIRVAVVTGRPLETARRIVGTDEVAYAADHGLTLLVEGRREAAPGLNEYEELARRAEREMAEIAREVPGIQIENKGALLGIHYRRADEPARAREAVLEAVRRSPAAQRFRLHEGRMVVELRPALDTDKGTAAEYLVRRLGLQGVICLGDDITDIDMFAAVGRARARGVAGAAVAVSSDEAAPEVAQAADYSLAGQESVDWLLKEMIRALP